MLVRFVTQMPNPLTGDRLGVFQAAYRLRRSDDLPDYVEAQISDSLIWFSQHLEVPARFNRTKSKAFRDRNTRGLCWLKPGASAHLSRLRELSAILMAEGLHVEMIRTANPGYVIYEDQHQVVAEPFRDLRTR